MQPKTMDTINNEDESTIPSLDSDNNASCKNDDMVTSTRHWTSCGYFIYRCYF